MTGKHTFRRLLSLMLVLCMLLATVLPASAAGITADTASVSDDSATTESLEFEEVDADSVSAKLNEVTVDEEDAEESTTTYADSDVVRVSIVLEGDSTIAAGYETTTIAEDPAAIAYRESLEEAQESVEAKISAEALDGDELDVVWNLTLAANLISANVEYGQIEAIEAVEGVKEVVLEALYEPAVVDMDEADDPSMATSGTMIGSSTAYAEGYTGAGSRIAIIDTGIDSDHQSFSAAGYNYSLAYNAGQAGMTLEEYTASLDLLDTEEIAEKMDQLNIASILSSKGWDADDLYVSSKIAFAFNYIDENLDITHDNDSQGEHGSHVTGIAAANAYIANADGTFSKALDSVYVQGVAPDAQVITMKVFGTGGGAYDSDYMAAIEDAIVLGCDSVNLSLGSAAAGFSRSSTYDDLLSSLTETDTVVVMSGGNSYSWPYYSYNETGYLYYDDVDMSTGGSPGSFYESMAVASVDNDGFTGEFLTVGDSYIFYTQTSYTNEAISTIAGDQQYVLVDGYGTEEEFAAIADVLEGKIAVCYRGSTSFYQKAEAAVKYGAIATIIINNTTGTISMDLSSYTKTQPVVSITQSDGEVMKAAATPVTDEEGNVLYYLGSVNVGNSTSSVSYNSEYYTMSNYSAWGVSGSLTMKPDITAPGGNIYSVNGADTSGTDVRYLHGCPANQRYGRCGGAVYQGIRPG